MTRKTTFDRARWTVQTGAGDPITITTDGGATWALRALIAAKAEGLHPSDTGGGKWEGFVTRLRESGLPVDDLPPDRQGRAGYRLGATVQRAG